MTPHLTPAGRWVLLAAVSLILAGAATTRWVLLLLGESMAVAMTVIYYLQVRSLWAVERGLLRVAVRPAPGRSAASGTVDQPVGLELELTNRSGVFFAYIRLTPEHSGNLAFDPPALELGPLRPRERLKLPMSARAGAVGRGMLHGFRLQAKSATGLVTVSDYLPASLPLKYLPASASARRALPRTTRRAADVQRMGAQLLRRRGFGSDFRELRDHHIGDPFRAIAWKATARTGKLMVREFEDEVIANTFVLLDISPTMRGGAPPRTKLQHAIELVTQMVQGLARSQDRVGLITFDEGVYGHLRTGPARVVQAHLVSHLVGLSAVVDPALTELDEDEVTVALARYLMVQERLDFRTPDGEGGMAEAYDVDLLHRWVSHALRAEEPRLGDASLTAGIVRREPLSDLRRFCQLRGVPIPYRQEAAHGATERGLTAAVECFLAETRESHVILLFTDFCGVGDTRQITTALRLALARKHRVVVVMPFTPAYVDLGLPPASPGSEAYDRRQVLAEILRLAERRERGRIARAVSSLGIPVLATEPGDSMESLLHRLSLGG